MRSSDPRVRIVCSQTILISTPFSPCKQQVATSNTVPILVFPWIHPFGCDVESSLGKVYSRQATLLICERSAVSIVMKYCPISTRLRNPASIQYLLNLSCCDSFSIRSPHCCKRRSLRAESSYQRDLSWSRLARMRNSIALSQRVAPFYREKFRILHTFCDCSVKAELIYRTNEKKSQSFGNRHNSAATNFHGHCFWADLWTMDL